MEQTITNNGCPTCHANTTPNGFHTGCTACIVFVHLSWEKMHIDSKTSLAACLKVIPIKLVNALIRDLRVKVAAFHKGV